MKSREYNTSKGIKNKKTLLENERILVVDDIQKWLSVTMNNLNYYGCRDENVIFSNNTFDAFDKYKKENPTMIFTDINFDVSNLEDFSGIYLIKKLRSDDYRKPVIAMSSSGKDIASKVIEAGADYFIDKANFVRDFEDFIKWYENYLK